jgi:ribose transport system ATP-binding protein
MPGTGNESTPVPEPLKQIHTFHIIVEKPNSGRAVIKVERKKLLEVKGCSKSFPGVKAFNNVDFELYEGEVHCVVGENGAGKSTFIKILSGALGPDEGTIIIDGQSFSHLSPHQAHNLGIQTTYQEISLAPDLTVAENIYINDEPVNKFGIIDYKILFKSAEELLVTLGIDIDAHEIVSNLSVPEKQSVQIAKAMAKEAKIFILDEPTASYSSTEISNLLGLVREVARKGVGVIYISHHLDEVFGIHDRITILRDGCLIATHNKDEVTEEKIISEMIGRDVSQFYNRERVEIDYSKFLEVKNFSNHGKVSNVSFKVHKGEILGFAGMVGSGRTDLMKMLFGAEPRSNGDLYLEGERISISNPGNAIKKGLSLLTEDRQKTGLILDHAVDVNISLAKLCNSPGSFINHKTEEKNVISYVNSINIKTPSIKQTVRNLSGGNQQKVVLAKWLYANSKIIIFDEPTRGIDIGAKEEIYKLMIQLAKEGKYIVMISSDMPELIAMCDRIMVMRQGKIVGELDHEECTEESILKYSIGGIINESK